MSLVMWITSCQEHHVDKTVSFERTILICYTCSHGKA